MDDSLKGDVLVFGRNGQSNEMIPKAYFKLVSITLHLLDIAQGERVSVGDFLEGDGPWPFSGYPWETSPAPSIRFWCTKLSSSSVADR
jgi:hypothetical protein